MEFLQQTYYGNSIQQWFISAGILIVTMLCLILLKAILAKRLGRLSQRTDTDVDNLILELVERIRFSFLLAMAVYTGTFALALSQKVQNTIQLIMTLAFIGQGALWGSCVIEFWISRIKKRRLESDPASVTTMSALGFVGKLILWTVLLLLALENLGINVTGLVTGLGIGGIAVALALQNILGDLFASLSIVLDKPFVIGDFIIVDNYLGTVKKVGLKTTRIQSLSGEQLIFSNNDLLSSRIRNYKRMDERRVLFAIGVTYQTPYEKLETIPSMVRKIVEEQQEARLDRVHFKEYGNFSLTFEIVYYVKSPDYNKYMDIQQAINLALYKRFMEESIEFAYPTQTLHIEGGAQNGSQKESKIAYRVGQEEGEPG